jgi:hypothetical protein
MAELDYRDIKLKRPDQKKWIDDRYSHMIEQSEKRKIQENMPTVYGLCQLYYEGYTNPIGSERTDNYADRTRQSVNQLIQNGYISSVEFLCTKKDSRDKIFVRDNKIKKQINRTTAYFTKAKKVITVKPDDNPNNDGIQYGVQHLLTNITRKKKYWEQIVIPAIHYECMFGLSWVDVSFTRRINPPLGDFRFNYYHPNDVLFDIFTKKKYFTDARYVIRKKQLTLEEAKRYFSQKEFGLSKLEIEKIKPDCEFNQNVTVSSTDDYSFDTEFVTVYLIEHTNIYTNKIDFRKTKFNDVFSEIPKEFLDQKDLIVESDEKYQFEAIYTPSLGTVYHGEAQHYDKYNHDDYQFKCVPLYNRQSGVRTHPIAPVEEMIPDQDLLQALQTLIFDNGRQHNKEAIVLAEKYAKYQKLLEDVMDMGGVATIPLTDGQKIADIYQKIPRDGIPPEIYNFLEIIQDRIKENYEIHEALSGQDPTKGSVTGVGQDKLAQANAQQLAYNEDNINWSMSRVGEKIYNIYALEYKTDEIIEILDQKKGDPKNTILNSIMSIDEYEAFVHSNFPEIPIEEATKKWEEKNEVEINYRTTDEYGRELTPEEIKQDGAVFINYLTDYDGNLRKLGISMEFDFKAEANEMQNLIYANELHDKQIMTGEDLIEYYPEPFRSRKVEIIENKRKENQVMSYAQLLTERPELAAMVDKYSKVPQEELVAQMEGQQ